MCLLLASCGDKRKPAYVILTGERSGLVSNFNAYFELNGNNIEEVREIRYDNLILRTDDYTLIEYTTYNFEATSTTGNPSDFLYLQKSTDAVSFDKSTLIKYLKKMGVFWTGALTVSIYEFDGYRIVEARHVEGTEVLEIITGLFRNGKQINLPGQDTIKSLQKVYKKI
jgi:hypothetical protein